MSNTRSYTEREITEMSHFDTMASHYDQNYLYTSKFTQYKIDKKVHFLLGEEIKKAPYRILEIGAGTGEYTIKLAEKFPNSTIIAIDISPEILQVAKTKCKAYKNIKFIACSAYSLPFDSSSFDIVCGFYILHHLSLDAVMPEVSRVLKSGSLGTFYEPNILNPVVMAIKSVPYLKRLAGDSQHEWAINPLTLGNFSLYFSKISASTSEFTFFPSFIPSKFLIIIDKLSSFFSFLPFFNQLGGSVSISLKK